GLTIWPALFLTAFAVSLRFLPARSLMTIVPPETVSLAGFSPDGHLVTQASVTTGETRLTFWRIPGGEEEFSLQLHASDDKTTQPLVQLLPDGKLFVEYCPSRSGVGFRLRFAEVRTGKEWLDIESGDLCGACLSRDGQTVAVLDASPPKPHIAIWDIAERRCAELSVVGLPVALSPGSKILVFQERKHSSSGQLMGRLTFWDIANNK